MIVDQYFSNLPVELQERVCECVGSESLYSLLSTCKSLYEVIGKNRLCQSEMLLEFARRTVSLIDNETTKCNALMAILRAQGQVGATFGARGIVDFGVEKALKMENEPDLQVRGAQQVGGALLDLRRILATPGQGGLPRDFSRELSFLFDANALQAIKAVAPQRKNLKFELLKQIVMTKAEINDVVGAKETLCLINNDQKTVEEIAVIQTKNGDIDGAKETVRLIEDQHQRSVALKGIAITQAKNKDVDGAKGTVCLIEDQHQKSVALKGIAIVQAKNKDVDGAKGTVCLIEDQHQKAVALKGIAIVQVKNGDIDEAKETFNMAKKEALLILDPELVCSTLIKIGTAQVNNQHADDAKETFTEVKEIALLIMNQKMRSLRLKEVALAQAKGNDVVSAKETVTFIDETFCQPMVFADIAAIQFQNKDVDGAKETLTMATVLIYVLQIDEIRSQHLLRYIKKVQVDNGDMAGAQETSSLIKDEKHVQEQGDTISGHDRMARLAAHFKERDRQRQGVMSLARSNMSEAKKFIGDVKEISCPRAIYLITQLLREFFQKPSLESHSKRV